MVEEKRGNPILAEEEIHQLSIAVAQPQPGGIRDWEQVGRPGPGSKLSERGTWWLS